MQCLPSGRTAHGTVGRTQDIWKLGNPLLTGCQEEFGHGLVWTPQRHPRRIYLCSLPRGQDQFDCPVTLPCPPGSPKGGSSRSFPQLLRQLTRDSMGATMCQLWSGTMKPEDVDTVGSFLQSRDCFLSGPVHRLENHVSHEQTESSWASDLCSLNSSFPINQNPDA